MRGHCASSLVLFFFVVYVCSKQNSEKNRAKSDILSLSPVCQNVINNHTLWTDWGICSNACGQGKQVCYLNWEGKNYARQRNCHITRQYRTCYGTDCKRRKEIYRFVGVASLFVMTGCITLYYMKRKPKYYTVLRHHDRDGDSDGEAPGQLEND